MQIVERFPERITYVHLKQVDPAVRDRVLAEKLPLSEAVKLGAMVEPPYGEPAMPPLLDALAKLDRDVFCVIEQDLYPVAAGRPAAHRRPHRGLLRRLRARPHPPLALLT